MYFKRLLLLLVLLLMRSIGSAQSCPSNLGFESGTFDGWKRYASRAADSSGQNPINWGNEIIGAANSTHFLIPNKSPQDLDGFGGFPVNSPNGSQYTLRLGNEQVSGGGRGTNPGYAERITYDFIVPDDDFTMVYYYAVVFQNPINHDFFQQPKFEANVINLDDPSDRPCGSFAFTATAGLRGFRSVPYGRETVYFKPWSPITIRIAKKKGAHFQLEFITRDCSKGGHFGYAYLDFNEKCVSPITGNNYCAGSFDGVTLTAPAGFETYTWTNVKGDTLSRAPTLKVSPAPPNGTMYSLHIMPYEGLGCENTFNTTITKVNEPFKLSVKGYIEGCAATGVNLRDPSVTAGSNADLTYEYYTDPDGQNFVSDPGRITLEGDYYIRGTNPYGCTDIGKIHVALFEGPDLNVTTPSPVCAPKTIDMTALATSSEANVTFEYFLDAAQTSRLPNPKAMSKTGYYYIKATSARAACSTLKMVYLEIEPLVAVTDKTLEGCPPLNLTKAIQDGSENGTGATFKYFTDAAATKPAANITVLTQSAVYYYYAINRYGCPGNIAKITVKVYPVPVLKVYEPLPVTYPLTVDITKTHNRPDNATFTYWLDAACSKALSNPTRVDLTGTYYIKAVNTSGCTDVAHVSVMIQPPPEPNLIAINTFTPNGDGVNDLFAPKVEGVFKLNFIKIYNRFGKEVFSSADKFMTWPGTQNGLPVPVGTYYWVFNAFDVYRQKEFNRSGSVTVVR